MSTNSTRGELVHRIVWILVLLGGREGMSGGIYRILVLSGIWGAGTPAYFSKSIESLAYVACAKKN